MDSTQRKESINIATGTISPHYPELWSSADFFISSPWWFSKIIAASRQQKSLKCLSLRLIVQWCCIVLGKIKYWNVKKLELLGFLELLYDFCLYLQCLKLIITFCSPYLDIFYINSHLPLPPHYSVRNYYCEKSYSFLWIPHWVSACFLLPKSHVLSVFPH